MLGFRPARLPSRGKNQDRSAFRLRMQLTELTALATDDRCVRQTQQSHGGAGRAGICNLLHAPGEDHVLAVGRNLPSIDVPSVLTVDKPAVLTIGFGHPELSPAVTIILRLSPRAAPKKRGGGCQGTSQACNNRHH